MLATHFIYRKFAKACTVLCLLAAAPVAAQADDVSNTAQAQWSVAGAERTTSSNTVSFSVLNVEQKLQTYVPMPGSNLAFNLDHEFCGTGNGDARPAASADGGDPSQTNAIPTDHIRPGQMFIVKVNSVLANIDPARVETIDLTVSSQANDVEHIVAYETDINTGEFVASLHTQSLDEAVQHDNCVLSLGEKDKINIQANAENSAALLTGEVDSLAEPYGIVFDSRDGLPVDGVRVTLVDANTGQPARVYAPDGITPYPSTVVTGAGATDSAGNFYPVSSGEYHFPLATLGNYRVVIEPPAPYTAPSEASAQDLARLRRPGGGAFEITNGSFGRPFDFSNTDSARFDIPIDAPGGTVTVDKTSSIDRAAPGDAIVYRVVIRNRDPNYQTTPFTLTDQPSNSMRIEPNSVRVDGAAPTSGLSMSATGHGFSLQFGSLDPGASTTVTYAMRVREDGAPGYAENRATVQTRDGAPVTDNAVVKITRDEISGRMTIIGRIVGGLCGNRSTAPGIGGVRVMLEDGSYAITDSDGTYHFEGVVPGTHVVRVIESTLPETGKVIDCERSTSSAGRATSRFIRGAGGALVRADFNVNMAPDALAALAARANADQQPLEFDASGPGPDGEAIAEPASTTGDLPEGAPRAVSDQEASGATTDWLAQGDGPDGFLFPAADHNPRSSLIRVVVRHRPESRVELLANGKAVSPLTFDSSKLSADKNYSVSIWRAVSLDGGLNELTAIIRDANGAEVGRYTRVVRNAEGPAHAEFLPKESNLLADGKSNPVLAVRFTDRNGAPVTSGMTGAIQIDSPYSLASEVDARRSETLSGQRGAAQGWRVAGDDGIAYIELAPTMVSGSLHASFVFTNGDIQREQEIEAWLQPGDQPWTIVGLGEIKLGEGSIAKDMQSEGNFDSDLGNDARVAFYAKGQILGKALLTIAYDSAKQKTDQRLIGSLDPSAYYTVYAGGSDRLYDAASREKLYIRIETAKFYAVYGDFVTGFNQTTLGRYDRAGTGVKAEGRFGNVQASAYAAKVGTRNRRDEFQGTGITGPYQLTSRNIVANSETVAIEIRDRLRGDVVIERRQLERFVDYDIDLLSATITFTRPLQSRNGQLDPQFAIINYEVDDLGKGEWNAGARAAWTNKNGNLRVGGTVISDKGDGERTNVGAVDVRARIGQATEIRAEAGVSHRGGETATAAQVEVEHNAANLNVLGYARQIDSDYGVGQQNVADRGRRTVGVDGQVRLSDTVAVTGRAWAEESLDSIARRMAGELRATWRGKSNDAFLGFSHLRDRLGDGRSFNTSLFELGGSQRLLNNKLELDAGISVPIGSNEANALPARYRAGARYNVSSAVRLFGTYEVAKGDYVDARTLEAGLEITPWEGASLSTSLGSQGLANGTGRTFGSYSLGQTLTLAEGLRADASIDGNKTIGGGIAASDVFNPNYPLPAGGNTGQSGSLGEDFISFSLGLSYNRGLWNVRLRGEYMDGEFADRSGLRVAAIRTLGEGSVLGAGVSWTRASTGLGQMSEAYNAALSFAYRPDNDVFAALGKLEYRGDAVMGAIAGEAGPAGQTQLLVDGDARLRRMLASVSLNYAPYYGPLSGLEVSAFGAARYSFDSVSGYELGTTSLLSSIGLTFDVNPYISLGARGSMRYNMDTGTFNYSFGPEIGISPVDNVLISLGYNFAGYRDPDFQAANTTDKGFCVTLTFKFDEHLIDDIVR